MTKITKMKEQKRLKFKMVQKIQKTKRKIIQVKINYVKKLMNYFWIKIFLILKKLK